MLEHINRTVGLLFYERIKKLKGLFGIFILNWNTPAGTKCFTTFVERYMKVISITSRKNVEWMLIQRFKFNVIPKTLEWRYSNVLKETIVNMFSRNVEAKFLKRSSQTMLKWFSDNIKVTFGNVLKESFLKRFPVMFTQ